MSLLQELYEKTSIYDEMVEVHQRELAAKQEELDQEVEACNRVYQTRLAEMEAAQEAKWMDLVKLLEFEQINDFIFISSDFKAVQSQNIAL